MAKSFVGLYPLMKPDRGHEFQFQFLVYFIKCTYVCNILYTVIFIYKSKKIINMTYFKCKSALIRQYITYFKVRLYSRKKRSFKLEGFMRDIAMKITGSGSLNYAHLPFNYAELQNSVNGKLVVRSLIMQRGALKAEPFSFFMYAINDSKVALSFIQ